MRRCCTGLVLSALLVGVTVFAQAAPDRVPGKPSTGEGLAPGQMLEQARSLIAGMQGVLRRVVQLQELARKQKDVIKLNCVNDKLVLVKSSLNLAEASLTNLHETAARGDTGGSAGEFERVTLTHQKVTLLGTEAENCVGEDLTFIGPTEVTVDIDPDLPGGDPTSPPEPEISLEQPPYATPY